MPFSLTISVAHMPRLSGKFTYYYKASKIPAKTGQMTGVKLDIATVGAPQVKYGLTSYSGGTYHEENDTQK